MSVLVVQGRAVLAEDLALIQQLMADNPSWGRSRLSEELCERWAWRNARGRRKDMAARSLLLKLERAGHVALPPRRGPSPNAARNLVTPVVEPPPVPLPVRLADLQPLSVRVVEPASPDARTFNGLLARYHYLGHRNTVGQNLRYLVTERTGTPVACLLFGSAAWACAARDANFGWDRAARARNLHLVTNNTRFLIPSWVRVPHLASHVLALVARRIRADWMEKYGHPVVALETFVERAKFRGTCYRAANWQCLGRTRGRTRNDRSHSIQAGVKDVYVYPLVLNFREELLA